MCMTWGHHHYQWMAAIFTYTRHSSISSEGFLTCHNYSDKGHSFIMVIYKDPWHSHLLPSVWLWSCLSRPWIEPRSPAHKANSLPLRHRDGLAEFNYQLLNNMLCNKIYVIKWNRNVSNHCIYCTHVENTKHLIFSANVFMKYGVLLVNFCLSKSNGNMLFLGFTR